MTQGWRDPGAIVPMLRGSSFPRRFRDYRRVFRPSLAAQRLRSDLLPASLLGAPYVHDVEGLGAVLLLVHVRGAGLELPRSERLCRFAPDAPRVQRHPEGPPLTSQLSERPQDDVGNERKL